MFKKLEERLNMLDRDMKDEKKNSTHAEYTEIKN